MFETKQATELTITKTVLKIKGHKMAIIDFQFPTLTPKGWRVEVAKITKGDRFYIQPMVFEDKDDALAYYEHVRQVWQKSKGRIR